MTVTLAEPPSLPARRFPISRKSVERNERSSRRVVPIVILVLVCAMGIPIAMNPPWDIPRWQAVGLYLALFVPCLAIIYASGRSNMRALSEGISFAVDSGFLVTYNGRHRHWYRTDLSKVTKVVVGDVEHPDEMRMHLTTHRGWVCDIPTTEDMEAFVAEVTSHIPVGIERRCTALPIWTRQTIVIFGLAVLFSTVFFTGLSYVVVQFL